MAIYAIRRENETIEKLINRLKKQIQGSRLVQLVRKKRYRIKDDTKRLVRGKALKREENREKRRKDQAYL